MRILILSIAAAGLMAAAAGLQSVDEAGYQKLLAANRGKVLIVQFWATWCKPCRAEMPELVKLEARLRSRGVKLVTISADEPEKEADAQKFAAQMGAPSPAYIRKARDDEKFAAMVDAAWTGALPALVLYDKSGKRVKSFFGETPMKDVEAAIAKLL